MVFDRFFFFFFFFFLYEISVSLILFRQYSYKTEALSVLSSQTK